MQEDYVRTAFAKGLRRERVVWVHVLRNSLAPLLSAANLTAALAATGILLVALFLELPAVVLGEAFLSVLGLGPQPPTDLGQHRLRRLDVAAGCGR